MLLNVFVLFIVLMYVVFFTTNYRNLISTLTPVFSGGFQPSSTFTGNETAANPNAGNATSVTMTAQWQSNCNDGISSVGGSKNFDYTGSVQTFNACAGRTYKLEVWGAEGTSQKESGGGIDNTLHRGGLGGYARGNISLQTDTLLYVYVGGQSSNYSGGWNGGGQGGTNRPPGGGGTDISAQGTANSSTWNESKHLYSRIIVAGGGAGNYRSGENYEGNGGGYLGGDNNTYGKGGQQTSGSKQNGHSCVTGAMFGIFGVGGYFATNCTVCGGGGGWYGGGSGNGGGGGSGYIYNGSSESSYPSGKLVNSNYYLEDAIMYSYNNHCYSSNATATKTTCTSNIGAHTANAANTGNGYARITYLGT